MFVHVVYATTVEALLVRAHGARLTPELRERLAREGLDLARPLKPAYSASLFTRCTALVGQALYPTLGREEVFEQMGRDTVRGFQAMPVGQDVVALGRMLGVRPMLERLGDHLAVGNNFVRTRLTELGPTSVELRVDAAETEHAFVRGLLLAMLPLFDVPDASVDTRYEGPAVSVHRIRWD